jgi:dihydrolipoamide dehydrogenase
MTMKLAQRRDPAVDEVGRNVFAHLTLTEAVKDAIHGIAGHMINP